MNYDFHETWNIETSMSHLDVRIIFRFLCINAILFLEKWEVESSSKYKPSGHPHQDVSRKLGLLVPLVSLFTSADPSWKFILLGVAHIEQYSS